MCNSRLIEEKSPCDTLDATLVTTHNPAFVIKGLRVYLEKNPFEVTFGQRRASFRNQG